MNKKHGLNQPFKKKQQQPKNKIYNLTNLIQLQTELVTFFFSNFPNALNET